MYQALLTRRYLSSKIMPWLATISVALCCMLTILVWSIMGGFLDVFRDIGRKLEGDVSITWPTAGFGYYDDLVARLEKDPAIAAAAPIIRTVGMVSLPDDRTFPVSVQGVDERYAKVANYSESLWWKPIAHPVPRDANGEDPRLDPNWPAKTDHDLRRAGSQDGRPVDPPAEGAFRTWEQMYQDGLRLRVADPKTGELHPAAVPGIEVGGFSARKPGGFYTVPALAAARRPDGQNHWATAFLPARTLTLTVVPMDKTGRSISTRSIKLPVANEFRAGFFETDSKTLLVHLSVLQGLLKMEAGDEVQEEPNPYAIEAGGTGNERAAEPTILRSEPAKVTTVLVKGKPGVESEEVRDRAMAIYEQFAADHAGRVPSYDQIMTGRGISTWERSFAGFIGQVQKETVTVLLMLLLISLVCTVLILAIFWSMVNEKTKDIGILRSVGCSRTGVSWIWLRYGLIIGVVGAGLGLALGCELVWNINPIHEWLGRVAGLQVWDQSVYYLPEIPNKVKADKAAIVAGCAVLLSLFGALIPAVRAANMDPVRALRFE